MDQFLTYRALDDIITHNSLPEGTTQEMEEIVKARDITVNIANVTDELVINKCGHYAKSIEIVPPGTTEKNYNVGEGACSICKKPINVTIPVFSRLVQETFAHTTEASQKPELREMKTLIDMLVKCVGTNLENPFLSEEQYSVDARAILLEEVAHLDKSLFKILPCLVFKPSNMDKYPESFKNPAKMAAVCINLFKTVMCLVEYKGLDGTASLFGDVYSGFYIGLRLLVNTTLSDKADKEQSESNNNFYQRIYRELSFCLASTFSPEVVASGFIDVDIAQMYATTVPRLVSFTYSSLQW